MYMLLHEKRKYFYVTPCHGDVLQVVNSSENMCLLEQDETWSKLLF